LNVLAYSIYNWQTFKGQASPNMTTWAVWSFMSILNFTSYKSMTKDGWKSLLPTISGIQCILTFVLVLFQGQLKVLGLNDAIVLVIGIIASWVWWVDKKKDEGSMIANLMVQVGVTVGFISTFQSVWVHPESETALCWFLWTISFAFQTGVVILRWKGQKRDLVYPINCLWLHFVVGLLALRH
jgi:Ca2+/Na+ antiporter